MNCKAHMGKKGKMKEIRILLKNSKGEEGGGVCRGYSRPCGGSKDSSAPWGGQRKGPILGAWYNMIGNFEVPWGRGDKL